jgi:SAM-dependent methyltransferase
MRSIGNFFYLLLLFFQVRYRDCKEERRIRRMFYPHRPFKDVDQALKRSYRFHNPYRISKAFLKRQGASDLHVYGETPLSSLELIFKEAGLNENDCFIDLGCGRGRSVFFASLLYRCRAIGIEWVPFFLERAQSLAEKMSFPIRPEFIGGDIKMADLSCATLIYFYGICMEEKDVQALVDRLISLQAGARIVTVSFPLTDYSSHFFIKKQFSLAFPWGKADVYLNIKH